MVNIVHWKCRRNNWGDAIANFIANKISNQKVKWYHGEDVSNNDIRYTVTGSINQWLRNNNTIIWGTGFISKDSKLHINPIRVCAVRGPLSRKKFLDYKIECPEIYGDPALLMPFFYNPNITKKYKYGIIPHYVDVNDSWVNKFKNNNNVKIIDITNTESELKNHRFINDILECEIILSSSLHGIIAADAYGIPSYWIELSDKVVGNGFKFNDYFSSVKRPIMEPFKPKSTDRIKDFSSDFYKYDIDIDLNLLYESCPFKIK